MSRGGVEQAADELCEVIQAIEDVDYNLLIDDDLRQLLDAKESVEELTLNYRRMQQEEGRHD